MTDTRYDVVVVGGGAAGLSAALTLGRARRSVLVIDAGEPRNAPAAGVHGLLAHDGIAPGALLAIGRAEVAGYGVEVRDGSAVAAARVDGGFAVTLADGQVVRGRRLLLTTGLVDELPDVAGLAQRWGRDVLHCPYCHGWEVRDQQVAVLADGPLGVHQALLFRQWTDDVTLLLHNGNRPTDDEYEQLAARDITVVEGPAEALEVRDDRLTGVRLRSGAVVATQALVVGPRMVARPDLLAGLGLEPVVHPMGVGSFVDADPTGLTAAPGVWVAGNVTDLMAQVVAAMAAGTKAGAVINADLVTQETRAAVERRRATAADAPTR